MERHGCDAARVGACMQDDRREAEDPMAVCLCWSLG